MDNREKFRNISTDNIDRRIDDILNYIREVENLAILTRVPVGCLDSIANKEVRNELSDFNETVGRSIRPTMTFGPKIVIGIQVSYIGGNKPYKIIFGRGIRSPEMKLSEEDMVNFIDVLGNLFLDPEGELIAEFFDSANIKG